LTIQILIVKKAKQRQKNEQTHDDIPLERRVEEENKKREVLGK
jgi:hypothetical protein